MPISRIAAVGLSVLACSLLSCTGSEPDPVEVAAATARAEASAHSLTSALIGELTKALESGSAAEAVNVCAEVAQSITIRNGGEDGFAIRRTALRLRNAVNAPEDYERSVLERWSTEADPQDWAEVVESAGGSELRWMRPIRLMPTCTPCHGTPDVQILPETLGVIRNRYPDDQATGFAPGDLRGAISVRAPL